ncbi:hypothetical protein PAEPH01_1610 [Pancytospora epiphaga]|nr:hypothetical protein PAEPH01_1610 [Pancytospora epiphaga]
MGKSKRQPYTFNTLSIQDFSNSAEVKLETSIYASSVPCNTYKLSPLPGLSAFIDTYADTSLVPFYALKHEHKLKLSDSKTMFRNNQEIAIPGELRDLPSITLGRKTVLLHTLVAKKKVLLVIGASTSRKHSFLLTHCLDNFHDTRKVFQREIYGHPLTHTSSGATVYLAYPVTVMLASISLKDVEPLCQSIVSTTPVEMEVSELMLCATGQTDTSSGYLTRSLKRSTLAHEILTTDKEIGNSLKLKTLRKSNKPCKSNIIQAPKTATKSGYIITSNF